MVVFFTAALWADRLDIFFLIIIMEGVRVDLSLTVCALVLGSCLVLSSCSDDTNPVHQYGSGITDAHKSARKLDGKVNILEVQKSIQEFYAANGRYPTDLAELSGFNGMTLKGDKYLYDPANGTLTEKP